MLRNYLKIAIRNFGRHRLSAFINVLGLTIGLTVCLLILLFVREEMSYDDFHTNADRIALVRQFESSVRSGTSLGPFVEREFGQVEMTTRVVKERALISTPEQAYYEDHFYFVDSTFFEVFDFNLLTGNPNSALAAPNSLIISEEIAQKYFPNQNPVGRMLEFNGADPLTVTGVMENTPSNSQLQLDLLCSLSDGERLLGRGFDSYWDGRAITYALLAPGTNVSELSGRLAERSEATGDQNHRVWSLALLPLRDIHLYHELSAMPAASGAIEGVYIFSIIAVFILALACFNYISLVTARSTIRSKEVGVRKVLGARQSQLLGQFLAESVFFVVVAVVLALGIVQLLLPTFGAFVGMDLSLGEVFQVRSILLFLAGIGLIGLLTGIYPALVLSSYSPVRVLKNRLFSNMTDALFRKLLVTVQFTVSIGMIIATAVVMRQLHYIQTKDLGYDRDQVLSVIFQGDIKSQQKAVFQQEANQMATVKATSFVSTLPGSGTYSNKLVEQYVPEGKDIGYDYIFTDESFLTTFGVELLEGRNFGTNAQENDQSFLVNQAMVEYLEWEDGAVGKELGYYAYQNTPDGGYAEVPKRGTVIGVIDNYHQSDLHSNIDPMVVKYASGTQNQLAVKVQAGQTRDVLTHLQDQWAALFPGLPFEFNFLDESFAQSYQRETQTAQLFGAFAGLAIFVSCLGLLGLITFAAQRRTKEIGIRKVLGASVGSIVGMLSLDFLRLVGLALLLAVPIAWYAMQSWLERFAYRIDIQWWIFALAGLIAFTIAFLTISFQATRAALVNPVESLKREG